jgi:hypothetical protein
MKSKVKFAAPSSGIFTVGNAYKNKQSNAIVLCILGGDAPTFNGVVLWQGIVICTSSDEMHATVFYGTVLYNQGKNDSLGTNKVFEKVNYREFTGAVTLEMK